MNRQTLKLIVILGVGSLIIASSLAVLGETFGDATISLQSHRYYKKWDLTRFVYRVTSPSNNIPEYWVLGTGDCIADDQIDWWSSSWFTQVDDPIEGVRFECYSKKQRFYLWLFGQWDVGSVDAVVVFGGDRWGDPSVAYQGTIDGPLYGGSSISVEVGAGSTVEFPQLLQAGLFPSTTNTQLVVSSTSDGWNLSYYPTFSIPENAEQSVVERILQVTIAPHGSSAGTTNIAVSYALNVTDQDFAGLPEGTYVIGITYTVTADD